LIVKELISQSIFPIQTSDLGDDVLHMMQVYHVRHLPIVNHELLLGVISEEDILIHDTKEAIGSYRLSFLRPFCYEHEHIFELIAKIGKMQLTMIPVISAEERFLGVITMDSLVQYMADHFSFSDLGSIIVLECVKNDYSLSEITRIAESEDASVLSCFMYNQPTSNKVLITLKLNRQAIAGLKATYQRFGYEIAGTFSEIAYNDGLKDRYDALMSYLNV
jgi:acetoin utilization protein AcuB